jgi:excisionase family DNA binding protein
LRDIASVLDLNRLLTFTGKYDKLLLVLNRRVNRSMEQPEEILTIDQTSKFLKVGKSTLYKMARNGKIPASKVGREWRFVKSNIIKWIKRNSNNN